MCEGFVNFLRWFQLIILDLINLSKIMKFYKKKFDAQNDILTFE